MLSCTINQRSLNWEHLPPCQQQVYNTGIGSLSAVTESGFQSKFLSFRLKELISVTSPRSPRNEVTALWRRPFPEHRLERESRKISFIRLMLASVTASVMKFSSS